MAADSVLRGTPLPDFGAASGAPHHGHADPNLVHAHDLVKRMGLTPTAEKLPAKEGEEFPSFFFAAREVSEIGEMSESER